MISVRTYLQQALKHGYGFSMMGRWTVIVGGTPWVAKYNPTFLSRRTMEFKNERTHQFSKVFIPDNFRNNQLCGNLNHKIYDEETDLFNWNVHPENLDGDARDCRRYFDNNGSFTNCGDYITFRNDTYIASWKLWTPEERKSNEIIPVREIGVGTRIFYMNIPEQLKKIIRDE